MKANAGFTLIELLIVVAIISILSAIAVPNFLEAQIRAKVARVKADQRTIVTALEAYSVDNNNKYPVRHDQWETGSRNIYSFPPLREKIYDPDMPQAAIGLHVLTTPISYITSIPADPFNMPVRALMSTNNSISDAMEYYDALQLDVMLLVMRGEGWKTHPESVGRGKGWVLISVGPDGYMGSPDDAKWRSYGYPSEPMTTKFTRKYFYDPTNGSVSTGNIYRFQGELDQRVLAPFG